MNSDWSSFAEGDSGGTVPGMIAQEWNKIYEKKKAENARLVEIKLSEIYAVLLGATMSIAKDSDNNASDRVAASEIGRKIIWDMSNSPQYAEEQARNGNRGLA